MSLEKSRDTGPRPSSSEILTLISDHDDALDFLRQHETDGNFCHDKTRMLRLTWKVDLIVIPFLLLAYLMNYLDKVLLNVSAATTTGSKDKAEYIYSTQMSWASQKISS